VKRMVLFMACLAMVAGFTDVSRSANELNGTYINQDNKSEYIAFSPDGKFFLKKQKRPFDAEKPYVTIEGTYTLSGDTVALKLPDGGGAAGKIQGDLFIDNQGKAWLKQGGTQVNPGMKFRKQPNL